jgi:hypothetical protein
MNSKCNTLQLKREMNNKYSASHKKFEILRKKKTVPHSTNTDIRFQKRIDNQNNVMFDAAE